MKKYSYPEEFGDCGDYLSEDDFTNMETWAAMDAWYTEAVSDGYEGTYEEYVADQKKLCIKI